MLYYIVKKLDKKYINIKLCQEKGIYKADTAVKLKRKDCQ